MMANAEPDRVTVAPLVGWDVTADRRWSSLALLLLFGAVLLSPIGAALASVAQSIRLADVTRSAALVCIPAILGFQVAVVCALALLGTTVAVRSALAGMFWVVTSMLCAAILIPTQDDLIFERCLGFYAGLVLAASVTSAIPRALGAWQLTGRRLHPVTPRLTILRLFITTTSSAVLLAIVAGRLRSLNAADFGEFLGAVLVGMVVGGLLAIVVLALMSLVLGRRTLGLLVGVPVLGMCALASFAFAAWNYDAAEPWTVRVEPAAAMIAETIAVFVGCLVPLVVLRLCGWHLRLGRHTA